MDRPAPPDPLGLLAAAADGPSDLPGLISAAMTTFLVGWFFVVGACVGSFVNVIVFRWPRRRPLAYPPSSCPACGHRIRARHNVPVLGWLALRGRCYDCGLPIPARYPLVELLFGVVAGGLAAWEGAAGQAMLRHPLLTPGTASAPVAGLRREPDTLVEVADRLPGGPLADWIGTWGPEPTWLGYAAAGVHAIIAATLIMRALTGSRRGRADTLLLTPAVVMTLVACGLEPRLVPWPIGPPAWSTPVVHALLSAVGGGLAGLALAVVATGGDPSVLGRRVPGCFLVGLATGWVGAVIVGAVGCAGLAFHRLLAAARPPAATPSIAVDPTPPAAEPSPEPGAVSGAAGPSLLDPVPTGEPILSDADRSWDSPILDDEPVPTATANGTGAPPEEGSDEGSPTTAPVVAIPPDEPSPPPDPEQAFDGWLAVGLIALVGSWPWMVERFAGLPEGRAALPVAAVVLVAGAAAWVARRVGPGRQEL